MGFFGQYLAMRLDGASRAEAPSKGALLSSRQFTIDAWVKCGKGTHSIIKQEGAFDIGVQDEAVYISVHGKPITVSGHGAVKRNVWTHIAAACMDANLYLYANGRFLYTVNADGRGDAAGFYLFGAGMKGYIRQVRVFNKLLEPNQILDYMYKDKSLIDSTLLTAYYNFNEFPAKELVDNTAISLKGNAGYAYFRRLALIAESGDEMKQSITLTAAAGSFMQWFVTANTQHSVKTTLFDGVKTYVKAERAGPCVFFPVVQGSDVYSGNSLTLELELDRSFEYKLTQTEVKDGSMVLGNSYIVTVKADGDFKDAYVQVSLLNAVSRTYSDDEFIRNLFYQYLALKKKYLVNYIQDAFVKRLCESYDTTNASSNVQRWFGEQSKALKDEKEKYYLILTTLLKFESKYATASLTYTPWADMVFAAGKKVWSEKKVTVQSCPFSYIRGILLNSEEADTLNKCKQAFGGTELFSGAIKLAAAHGSKTSHLSLAVTRALNFRNYGLSVKADSDPEQRNIITKSIAKCIAEGATVLIYPELGINESVLPFLIDCLNTGSGNLKLVVGASQYLKNSDDSYYNSAPVLAKTQNGWEVVTRYNKMIPFSMGYSDAIAEAYHIDKTVVPPSKYDLLVEDIRMSSNVVVLPFKDGIAGVAICRDAMDLLDVHNPLHKYCDFVDLMLVISDNTGDSNMFVGTAECLARWHNCATLYTNSVAETQGTTEDNKLEVSFGIYPKKGGASSTSVAGDITYISNPFKELSQSFRFTGAADAVAPFIDTPPLMPPLVTILYSSTLTYSGITPDELDCCCKVYTMQRG